MERYEKLLSQYEKLKSKYESNTEKSDSYEKIFNNLFAYLKDLKTAIEKNNNDEIVEISAQVRILMDGLKLLIRKNK